MLTIHILAIRPLAVGLKIKSKLIIPALPPAQKRVVASADLLFIAKRIADKSISANNINPPINNRLAPVSLMSDFIPFLKSL